MADYEGQQIRRIESRSAVEQNPVVSYSERSARLPERGEANDSDFIFPLTHEGTVNDTLQHWAKVAGITKHISFHVSRHTHATMMLTLGADLYTVSKLLGHKNIATTQIYAKIVDKKKEEAIGLIPNLTD